MPVEGDYECFSDDWRRTNPDLVFFLPKQPPEWVEAVDHVLVSETPGGDLLAIWTYGTKADASDHTVLYARSEDNGRTWSEPGEFDPPGPKPGQASCFGFPVISRTGRIYAFYNKGTGIGLALVDQLAASMGAVVRGENAEGGGLRVLVSFAPAEV